MVKNVAILNLKKQDVLSSLTVCPNQDINTSVACRKCYEIGGKGVDCKNDIHVQSTDDHPIVKMSYIWIIGISVINTLIYMAFAFLNR